MATGTAPLHIDRQKLIDRLTEVAAEAAQKRQESTDAAKARRASLLDTVSKLTADQVANILDHFVCSGEKELEDWVTDKVDNEKFVSKELEITAIETNVEKQIRVLEMATDTSVELQPTDSLYAYL